MTMRSFTPGVLLLLAIACRDSGRVGAASSDAAQRPAPASRLDTLLSALEPGLASLVTSLDSMQRVLRTESGSVGADSDFMSFRDAFAESVTAAAKSLDDSAFKAIFGPDGVLGDRQREQGTPTPRADSTGHSAADSIARFLEAHGIRSYFAEGDTYFAPSEHALLDRFGSLITEPTREFLRIESLEQTTPTGGDASIGISWDALGDRLASVDRLLATYPDAAARAAAAERRWWYLNAYLAGWDNTPAFDRESGRLRADVRASYERYVAEHASTASGATARDYLAVLRASGYRQTSAVKKFLELALARQ